MPEMIPVPLDYSVLGNDWVVDAHKFMAPLVEDRSEQTLSLPITRGMKSRADFTVLDGFSPDRVRGDSCNQAALGGPARADVYPRRRFTPRRALASLEVGI
jgi:hypothetical protein